MMGRRGGHKHCGFKRLADDQRSWTNDERWSLGVSWCGEEKLFTPTEMEEPLRLVTCNKCSQAIGKAKIARAPGRVRLEKVEPLGYSRSTYELWLDGVHRGFVLIPAGWGMKWEAHALADTKGYSAWGYGENRSQGTADYFKAKGHLDRHGSEYHDVWPVHYASKEAMAAGMLALFDKRPSAFPLQWERDAAEAKRKADDEARRVEREAEAARYAAKRVEDKRIRDERLEAWRLAYADLAARGDLSNLERAGIEAAAALIGCAGS